MVESSGSKRGEERRTRGRGGRGGGEEGKRGVGDEGGEGDGRGRLKLARSLKFPLL